MLADSGVRFMQAAIDSIDLDSKSVTLKGSICDDLDGYVIADEPDAERTVHYDNVVLALGAEPITDLVKGAKEHAIPFYTIEDSYRLQRSLRSLAASSKPDINIVIVGGNICGVEVASTIVGYLGKQRADVTMVSRGPELLSAAAAANQKTGAAKMSSLGVTVLTSTSVDEVKQHSIVVSDKNSEGSSRELPADLVVWTAGSKPNSLLKSLDLPKDDKGRVRVSSLLNVPGREEVYCLGDCAVVEGADAGSTAQVAMQQSEYAAYNIAAAASVSGKKPLAFKYSNLGEMLTLGAVDGSVSALNVVNFRGPAAALARRAVYAARMPTPRQRVQAVSSIAAVTAARLASVFLEAGSDAVETAINAALRTEESAEQKLADTAEEWKSAEQQLEQRVSELLS